MRTFFSSRRAFWDEVRSAFRLFLFTSWDQVLVRMNSPPQPLPPLSGSIAPNPVPTRGTAPSDFLRPHNHATHFARNPVCALPRQQRLAQPSPTRNPLVCAGWLVLSSASPPLGRVGAPVRCYVTGPSLIHSTGLRDR